MVTLPKTLQNPLIGASILCIGILYFIPFVKGKTPVQSASQNQKICSLFCEEDITCIEGFIIENPVKSSRFSGSYRTVLRPYRVFKEEAVSSATGKALVYIPSAFVEAYFPGKVYTKSLAPQNTFKTGTTPAPQNSLQTNALLAETGAKVRLQVKRKNGCFIVSACTALGWKKGVQGAVDRFRSLCRLSFRRLMYEWSHAGGLLLALLSGAKEYTEEKVSDAFSKAGLAHILALSGMHLSLFSSLSRFLGRHTFGERFAKILQLFSVLFFVCFAGISPSLFRALLCSLLITLNAFFKRPPPKLLTVLAASFLVHACIFPQHLESAAFTLSYGSLAGILVLSSALNHLYTKVFFPMLSSPFSASTSAQIMTAPVNITLFKMLSPVGIVASVVVSPFVTLFLYAGLAGIVLCLMMPFLSPLIRGIMLVLYGIIKELVLFFEKCPSISFT